MSSNAKRTIVVTGASRGLGLEWVKQLSSRPDTLVVAVVRSPEKAVALQELERSNIVTIRGDLSNLDSFEALAREIGVAVGGKINVLINNAAVLTGTNKQSELGISKSSPAEWAEHFHVNVTSLVFFTIALLPFLDHNLESKVVNIASFFGDIKWTTTNPDLQLASYAVSKAAVTMANLKFHNEFKEKGLIFIAINPGWVGTDMGGSFAPLRPEESIQQCLSFVDRAQRQHSGGFFTLDGQTEATTG